MNKKQNLLALLILFTFVTTIYSPVTATNHNEKYENHTHTNWEGVARNYAFGINSGISLKFYHLENNTLAIVGEFDNITLFGHFEVEGKEIHNNQGVSCIQLTGKLFVGNNDHFSFENGTTTTFTLTLNVVDDKMEGVYQIGILPEINIEQHGMFSLIKK